jgi:hypothetical protein
MTRDDITRIARVAGFVGFDGDNRSLRRFAALVATAEREACAKVCDSLEEQCEKLLVPDEKWPTPADCAHIIRARGNT